MRAHAVKHYESVIQVLNEPGCPICTYLKNVQSRLLQEGDVAGFTAICNAHAWALAAVRRSVAAAEIFLRLIEKTVQPERRECTVCIRLDQEETLRTQELLATLQRHHVLEWTEKRGVFCLPHGLKLRDEASDTERKFIDAVLSRTRASLKVGLQELIGDAGEEVEPRHGGVLGKAAEFLVAQRGVALRFRKSSDVMDRTTSEIQSTRT